MVGDDKDFQASEVLESYRRNVGQSEPLAIFTQQSAGCRAFMDALVENHLANPPFIDGYQAQRVSEAALEAHKSAHNITFEAPA
ncbi:MAG: hypothetical protein ABI847_10455 [Anaerolineales bacterium]